MHIHLSEILIFEIHYVVFLPNTILRRGMGVTLNKQNLSDDTPVPFAFLYRNELFESIFAFLRSYTILPGHGGIFL